MQHFITVTLIVLAVSGCAGGGGGAGNDDEITLCTTYEDMDTALDRAAQLWNERHTTPADESAKPPGAWLDFQSIANHEVGHIVMQGSGDEHTEDHAAVMHHSMCWNCRKHRLTASDEAMIDREIRRDELRTVVYLGVQEDTSICDYVARWVDDDGRIGRVRGAYVEFRRDMPWAFPQR